VKKGAVNTYSRIENIMQTRIDIQRFNVTSKSHCGLNSQFNNSVFTLPNCHCLYYGFLIDFFTRFFRTFLFHALRFSLFRIFSIYRKHW